MTDEERRSIASARDEAKRVAGLLREDLLRDRVDPGEVTIVSTTVVYKRGDKVFHLVVHDMTDWKP